MPAITLRAVANVLIQDGHASQNDAKILEKLVEGGHASRTELDQVIDVIESSTLGAEKKKHALRELRGFLSGSAQGIEKSFFAADVALTERLSRAGVTTST